MVPILAKNAVKIKCNFPNAVMTGTYDEKVSECVKLLKPYYLRFPDSETVGCIDDIRDQMIAKL